MTPEAWTALGVIVTALSGAVVAVIKQQRTLRSENTTQHAQSYGLLQSMDTRLGTIDEKLDQHGERLAVVEHDIKEMRDR